MTMQVVEPALEALKLVDSSGTDDHSSTGKRRIVIVLPRNDLRLVDNACIYHAYNHEDKPSHVLPLYVFDERQIECSGLPNYKRKGPEARTRVCGFWRTGVFRARFLTEAVYDLRDRLQQRGSDLLIRFGLPHEIVGNVVKALQERGDEVIGVEMQKEICAEEVAVERAIKRTMKALGVHKVRTHGGKQMIHPNDLPFEIKDTPDVFTPFRKKVELLADKMIRKCIPEPEKYLPFPENRDHHIDDQNYGREVEKDGIEKVLAYFLSVLKGSYEMKYADPRASKHRSSAFPWPGGETSALERLEWYFVTGAPPPVSHYKETRNMLIGHAYSTKMSPFLSIGCISPRQICAALDEHEKRFGSDQNTYWVRFELLWRDYFMYVSEKYGNNLFHIEGFEKITDPKQAEKKKDDWNDWDPSNPRLKAWMHGRTGIPFIDANIVELRETGFMSNRGRQNVASFLTKDLYFDWRIGAEFFESHLVDFEPTANWGNWQYVAGVGNDPRASRQFNPIKQARDYDPTGDYVRTWIPQLKDIPAAKVHTPWLMDEREWRKYLPTQATIDDMHSKSAQPTQRTGGRDRLEATAHGLKETSVGREDAQHPFDSSYAYAGSDKHLHDRSEEATSESSGSIRGSRRPSFNGRARSGEGTSESMESTDAEGDQVNNAVRVRPSSSPTGSFQSAVSSQPTSVSTNSHQSEGPEGLQDPQTNDSVSHESASSLMRDKGGLGDYENSTPYPRRPLLEQSSWKPHYNRRDLGRRKVGSGGGNSRRLIRPGSVNN